MDTIGQSILLSMQIICDYLDDQYTDFVFYRRNDRMILEDVRLYYGQQETSEHFVYLVSPEYLPKAIEKNCSLIVVGDIPDFFIPEHFHKSIIHVQNTDNIHYILELIQDIFSLFHNWSGRLVQILLEKGSVADICYASKDIFRNPLYILDHDNNAVVRTTYVVGMMTMKPDPLTGNLILPPENRNRLLHSEEFLQTYKTRTAQYWTPSWNKHRDIYINIFDNNQQYIGRILLNELQSSFKPSHLRLLEYFEPFIRVAFMRQHKEYQLQSTPLQNLLEQLLFSDNASEETILDQLTRIGWHQKDSYLVAKSVLTTQDSAFAYSVCLDVIEKSIDGIAFFRNNELYTVFHLPQSDTNTEPYYASLHEIGLKAGIHFGASTIFFNILKLRPYSEQASLALSFGVIQEPDRHCHPYARIALNYLLKNAVGPLKPHMACSPALRTLERIDREKGSDYYNTLKEYIKCNCQPVLTAKNLFLHRGTLTYRLNKITELTNLNLNDQDTIFYLDLSFRIIDLYRSNLFSE